MASAGLSKRSTNCGCLRQPTPTAQIAEEMGRGKGATIMKAHELNISLSIKRKAGSRLRVPGHLPAKSR
jgi:hypothetical protein